MHTFLTELQTRHRASLAALIKRHKSGIGYLILLIGVIAALAGVIHAQNAAETSNRIKSAVLCQNLTRADKQTLTNLHTKVDKELIKNLHLSQKQVEESVHKQLVFSAEERKALQPSAPEGACSPNLTTLHTHVPSVFHK